MIAEALELPVFIILMVVLVFNLSQRRHLAHGEEKRFATLRIAGLFLILSIELLLIRRAGLPDWSVIPAIASIVLLGYIQRERIAVFRFHCEICGRPVSLARTFFYDDNLCPACIESHETLRRSGEESTQFPDGVPETVEGIDWESWVPDERAVLCFVQREDDVLLIEKKTGLGAGKVNAPGGRIEPGESAHDAAIRETIEETDVTPSELEEVVDLKFVFTNGYSLEATVFFAASYSGTPTATREADPFWCPVGEIPLERMWADDAEWLPRALDGERLSGRFVFDGDRMISKLVDDR